MKVRLFPNFKRIPFDYLLTLGCTGKFIPPPWYKGGLMKRTAKCLCVTIVTGLLLVWFVVIFTYHSCFLVFNKKICLRKVKFGENLFQTKLLSHKVCHLLSSSILLSKFPNIMSNELHSQSRNCWHVYPGFIESIKNYTLSKV